MAQKDDQIAIEFDLERTLVEQDTHDLYCPNCKSPITRRVILRKRERTEPDAPEPEAPGAREPEAPGAPEPVVFRCSLCCCDIIIRIEHSPRCCNDWDVLKSIVYGGLAESIASLGVVSSAAAADASTFSIVALGLANLFGGFLLIIHKLFELKKEDERAGRYWELLGWKANFRRHFVVVILSYLLVGSVPPVVYGFSFRGSDNKEHKIIAVAAASLLCIALLAIGKAHVGPQRSSYIKTLFHYLFLGVSASGVSYLAGVMANKLLEKFGLFDGGMSPPSPPGLLYQDLINSSGGRAWASY